MMTRSRHVKQINKSIFEVAIPLCTQKSLELLQVGTNCTPKIMNQLFFADKPEKFLFSCKKENFMSRWMKQARNNPDKL